MKQRSILLFISFLSCLQLFAQQEYEQEKFITPDGDTIHYRMLIPENYDPNKKYPVVLFLHGAGERGNDNEKQLTHGAQMFLNPVNREKYPCFVIFPQCPENEYWGYAKRPKSFVPDEMPKGEEMNPVFRKLKHLLDTCRVMPKIDNKRIYIIGISMGAMGTYDIVSRYPEIFAAAIPICGMVNPERLSTAKDVKFRIFHGDGDNIVPVKGSREAYRALKKAGAEVEYFELPGCGHDSWNPAFNYPDFMEWLFKQRKK